MPRYLSILALLGLQLGCVVHYGKDGRGVAPAEPLPPPDDFAEVEERLDMLITGAEDADRLDRLHAAHNLARRMRQEDDPTAQRVTLAYLREVVAIEERSRPVEAPVFYDHVEADVAPMLAVPIVEEELDWEAPEEPAPAEEAPAEEGATTDEAPAEEGAATDGAPAEEAAATDEAPADEGDAVADASAPPEDDAALDVASMLADAEARLQADDPYEAMQRLEPCRNKDCWAEASELWGVARDAYVHHVREDAGRKYLAARNEADLETRRALLNEVRTQLADLVDRYPDSRYAGAIRRNVELVQRELEASLAESP